ncbi:hypothetical protein [Mucilaginibacter defluvii]|uniref:Uncharacterized protein n=1 Tax=Mucilaginibacter defluvii TaxID=1196019 RepID=A0ABP9FN60_9SPHI|nr:hypothetical protein [Bacteroidota bacterium]
MYVEQGGLRTSALPFTILKGLPDVDAVYYVVGQDIYVSKNENGVFTGQLLYGSADAGTPFFIKSDNTRKLLYWINMNNGNVMQAPMDGSGPVKAAYAADANGDFVQEFGVDEASNKLYLNLYQGSTGIMGLFELDLNNASTPKKIYDLSAESPFRVEGSGTIGKVFWTEYTPYTKIRSTNINGSGSAVTLFESAPFTEVSYIAIDDKAGKLYYYDGQQKLIQVNLSDGGGRKEIATTGSVSWLRADPASGLLYWRINRSPDVYRTDTENTFTEQIQVNVGADDAFTISHKQ